MTAGPVSPHAVTAGDFPRGRWRARWVWTAPAPISLSSGSVPIIDRDEARGHALLRHTFTLDPGSVPKRAAARATADARYALWVNGREVSRGPVRGHPQRLRYDLFDLAPHLHEGENVLAVHARFYGEAMPWWMPSTETFGLGGGAFVFEAVLGDPNDPATRWLTSDDSWRALTPDAWTELAGQGIGDMAPESCDARQLPARWREIGFDDDAWPAALMLTPSHVGYTGDPHPPTHPYGALLPRPVPQLTGSTLGGVLTAVGHAPVDAEPDPDPVAAYGRTEALVTDWDGPPPPAAVMAFDLEDGTPSCVVAIIDFGEQVAGHIGLELDAPAGTRIDVKAAEARGPDGRLVALQQHNGFRYIARGGDDSFETFDKIGLRYLGLAIHAEGPVTLRSVTVREQLFPRKTATSLPGFGPAVPSFACSDPLLDDIWRIGRRTVDLCSNDAYLDCSSREQRAWTGDSVVHQLVDLTTNPDWSLAVWNVELGASPRPDGMLPMAAGGDFEWAAQSIIPDWSLHWIHALHNLWRYTGDRDLVGSLLSVAERALRWFVPFQDRDGLLGHVAGWVLIDWSAVSTTGKSAALNALWVRALHEFAAMSRELGDAHRAAWATARANEVAVGFEQFWDADRSVYVDHILDGCARRPVSQHSNAAAIVAGLVPQSRCRPLAEAMIDSTRLEHASWLMPGRAATLEGAGDMYTGFMYLATGTPEPWWDVETRIVAAQPFYRYIVHDAVAAVGRADLIPQLCRDWQVLMERSATTWSEVWFGGSHCHGWASTPTRDLMQHTLGIMPGVPGFASASIRPHLGDLEWARGAVPTPDGLLHVRVDRLGVDIDTPLPAVVDLSGLAPSAPDPPSVTHIGPGTHRIDIVT